MTDNDIGYMSAKKLAVAYRRGKLSPVEADDAGMLRMAAAFEKLMPWADARPPLDEKKET